jgi:hypothetical protein
MALRPVTRRRTAPRLHASNAGSERWPKAKEPSTWRDRRCNAPVMRAPSSIPEMKSTKSFSCTAAFCGATHSAVEHREERVEAFRQQRVREDRIRHVGSQRAPLGSRSTLCRAAPRYIGLRVGLLQDQRWRMGQAKDEFCLMFSRSMRYGGGDMRLGHAATVLSQIGSSGAFDPCGHAQRHVFQSLPQIPRPPPVNGITRTAVWRPTRVEPCHSTHAR